MLATFNRFEIELTKNQALTGYHTGECIHDIEYLLTLPKIKRQLKEISDKNLLEELKEYGAWTKEELQNRQDNEQRIIWLACGLIYDET